MYVYIYIYIIYIYIYIYIYIHIYIYIYVKRLSQNRFDLIPTFYHSSRGKVLSQNEMFRPNVHTLVKK